MKHLLLHRLATVILVFGTFFSVASLAHANTFTLPEHFQYAGLTFSEPLTYNHPFLIPQPTASIAFIQQTKLEMTKDDSKQTLDTTTLTPALPKTIATTPEQLPTPTLYLQPTKVQTTSTAPTPTTTPHPTQQLTTPTTLPATATPQTAGGVSSDKLFSMVNSYRQSKGISTLKQDDRTCRLATVRATEIAGEMTAGTLHSGMYARNLPYWNTENAIALPSEEAAFNWWINEPVHRQAIENSNYTISCVACSGNYCVQEFTSYQPK